MSELLSSIFQARDKVLMLLILTVAVFFVTWLIYVISGRSGPIKYLPGLLLTTAGIYYLYRSMQTITTPEGLNEMISALIFTVIGLVGICFSMILGIYDAGAGRKTKRRAHALDFLQEARSAEPVHVPAHGLPESRPEPAANQNSPPPTEQPRNPVSQQPDAVSSTTPVEAPLPAPTGDRAQRYAAFSARSDILKKNALIRTRVSYAEEKETARLSKLESDLMHKNRIRARILAYNEKAEQKAAQEKVTFMDQTELFLMRALIAFLRKTGEARLAMGAAFQAAGIGALHRARIWLAYVKRMLAYPSDFIRSLKSSSTQS